jgi:hypothetical protein
MARAAMWSADPPSEEEKTAWSMMTTVWRYCLVATGVVLLGVAVADSLRTPFWQNVRDREMARFRLSP